MSIGIILVAWSIQVLIMSLFDTRLGCLNAYINVVALVASTFVTFQWGGWLWLAVPLIAIPVIGGVLGGIGGGLRSRKKHASSDE